jgi:hypothetical protein
VFATQDLSDLRSQSAQRLPFGVDYVPVARQFIG